MIFGNKSYREIIGELVGEASMCWDAPPEGIFDATRAEAIANKILDLMHVYAVSEFQKAIKIANQEREGK